MKKLILFITLVGMVSMAQAEPWSLDSCIGYANDHSLTVRQALIQQLQQEQAITSAKDKFLPSVAAGANQSWDFGRGLTSENTYANRNTAATSWNVGMNWGVFQGLNRWREVQYNQALLKQVLQQVEAAREDITLNVMAQYLQVLYAKELAQVARQQYQLTGIEAAKQETLLENGKVSEADVIQVRAQLVQDSASIVTAENDVQLALVNLAKLIELDHINTFDIQPLDSSQLITSTFNPDEVYERALMTNHTILGAKAGIEAADKSITMAKTGYYPTLSFQAGLGSSYYQLSGAENPSFGKQMGDNFSKQLGFSLSIPIFDAFSTRNAVRQAKTQKLAAELELEQQSSSLFKAIRQAYYEAVAADKKLESTTAAVAANKAAYDIMATKYEYGKANSTDYETAKTNYIKSLAELTQAKYELILRRKILAFYNR